MEIGLLRESAYLVSKTLAEVAKVIGEGKTLLELDKLAEQFIRDSGALPAFKGYGGFPATLCTSVNDVVVHGIPNEYVLKDGDIVSIDCGVVMNGYYGDSAYTFSIGNVQMETSLLLDRTKESLYRGINQAIAGNRIGDIGFAVQDYCESFGYGVVKDLCGHGIGKKLHDSPEVPNFGRRGVGKKLYEGLVICIEPMINKMSHRVYMCNDKWTIKTKDGQPSAHYEHQIVVRHGRAEILSSFDLIETVLNNRVY